MEIEKGRKPRIQKRKDSIGQNIGTMNVGRITRRLSKILSVGDRIGDQDIAVRSERDTTPMIAEGKSLFPSNPGTTSITTSTRQDRNVTTAPLKKGFTRRGLREKHEAAQSTSSRV